MVLTERTPNGPKVHNLPDKPQVAEAPKVNPAAGQMTPEELEAIKNAKPVPMPTPAQRKAMETAASIKRKQEIASYYPFAMAFLDAQNHKNVVPIDEFQHYVPIFNKEAFENLDEDERATLSYQWAQRINIQQPVLIVDTSEPDPRGGKYKGKRYKVLFQLPAWTNRVESVNAQGDEAVKLAAEYLANARATSNPFDTRLQKYSGMLKNLLVQGTEKSRQEQEAAREKITQDLKDKKICGGAKEPAPTSAAPSKPTTIQAPISQQSDNPESLDADWEE